MATLVCDAIGVLAFLACAVINSVTLYLYNTCGTCYNASIIPVNVIMMIFSIVSLALCLVFPFKVIFDITYA
jgi:hypothetical protein